MTGGMIASAEAIASTAAAAGESRCASSRIVIGPSTITLATALPETVPNSAEDTIATLPGPPAV
jgi:hypothetical protein